MTILLALIFFILFCVFFIVTIRDTKKSMSDLKLLESYDSRIADFLSQNKFVESAKFSSGSISHYYRVIFDEKKSKMIIFELRKEPIILDFMDILGTEIRENGAVCGGVGRAIVGSAIAGGVGAIVGSATAKEKVISFELSIICNSISTPEFVFDLISKRSEITRESIWYKYANDFANGISSAIKVILNRRI